MHETRETSNERVLIKRPDPLVTDTPHTRVRSRSLEAAQHCAHMLSRKQLHEDRSRPTRRRTSAPCDEEEEEESYEHLHTNTRALYKSQAVSECIEDRCANEGTTSVLGGFGGGLRTGVGGGGGVDGR